MQLEEWVIFRPMASVYAIFCSIWGVLVMIGAAVIYRGASIWFPVFWIGVLGGAISFALIRSVSLSISTEGLRYRNLFGDRSVRFDDISHATFSRSSYSPFGPAFGLSIFEVGKEKAALRINVKILSPLAHQRLNSVLTERNIKLN